MKVFFVIVVLSAGLASGWGLVGERGRWGKEFMSTLTRCDDCKLPRPLLDPSHVEKEGASR